MSFMAASQVSADPLPCLLAGTAINTCDITFQNQPADAQKGTTITSVAGNTNGAPVQVLVTNGLPPGPQSGVTVTLTPNPGATISGNVAVTDANGIATFASLKIADEGRFTLTASAPASNPTTSSPFTTYDDGTFCPANTTCTASASDGTTTTSVSVPPQSGPGAVFVSMGLDSVSCGGPANGVATTDSTYTGSGTKTATVRIDKSAVLLAESSGAAHFNICFQGVIAVPTGTILPDCGVAPCVSARHKDNAGDMIIEITLPLGDPKFGWCVDGTTVCV
jgi:hypothetical protein